MNRMATMFRLSFGFSIHRANRDMKMLCLKERNYSSSDLIRYIPKKSQKAYEKDNVLPLRSTRKIDDGSDADATAYAVRNSEMSLGRTFSPDAEILPQARRRKDYLFGNTKQEVEEELVCDSGVRKFMKKPKELVQELGVYRKEDISESSGTVPGKTRKDAENKSFEWLATRAFTAVELRKKLQGKKFPAELIEEVVNDLQSRGFINDGLYAESYTQSKWSSLNWGPAKIKQSVYNKLTLMDQALFKKGVNKSDIENAIKLVFENNGESSEDQESKVGGLSKLALDKLYIQASKQWVRAQDIPNETRKSRIIRWLQYRGFNWGVVSFILKKLETR